MHNYKLKIQYDGTNYAGWQIQKNAPSIQQKIESAINLLLKDKIILIGSGRTDAGVHALGQVANFQSNNEIDIFSFKHSLNGILPSDISIINMETADENFHARFDAKRRIYFYLISDIKSPFLLKYSYFLRDRLDLKELNYFCNELIGKHDFTLLSRINRELDNKICNIYSAQWRQTRFGAVFKIEADRYLHGMVRIIVSTLLKAQKKKMGIEYIQNILSNKNNLLSGGAAPAKGLFLYKVLYD